MRLLLDTHLLLWAVASSERLSPETRALIEDPRNDVQYSAASGWEIAIKSTLRRRDFRVDLLTGQLSSVRWKKRVMSSRKSAA